MFHFAESQTGSGTEAPGIFEGWRVVSCRVKPIGTIGLESLRQAAKFPPPFHIAKKMTLFYPGRKPEVHSFEKVEPQRTGFWGTAERRHKGRDWKQKDQVKVYRRATESPQVPCLSQLLENEQCGWMPSPRPPVRTYRTLHTSSGMTLEDFSLEILKSTKQGPNGLGFGTIPTKSGDLNEQVTRQ